MTELRVDLSRDFDAELEDHGYVLFLDDGPFGDGKEWDHEANEQRPVKYHPFNHPVPDMRFPKPSAPHAAIRLLGRSLGKLARLKRREFRFGVRIQPRGDIDLDDIAQALHERHGVPKGEAKPNEGDKAVWIWGLTAGLTFREAFDRVRPFVESVSSDKRLHIVRMQLEFVETKEI